MSPPAHLSLPFSHCWPSPFHEGADRGWEISQTRALVGYILIRRLGYKLKDVAKFLGRDVATVSSLVSRFAVRMGENQTLRKQAVRLLEDCQEMKNGALLALVTKR